MNLGSDLTNKVPVFGALSRNNRVQPMQTTLEVRTETSNLGIAWLDKYQFIKVTVTVR